PGPRIRGAGVDRPPPRQDDGIVVVVELAGIEESPGEAVVLSAMVPVVLVGAQGMDSEAPVLSDVERELIAMAENDAFAIAPDEQLGGQGSVEGPQRQRPLVRQVRVEARREGSSGVDARIEARRNAWIVDRVDLGPFRRNGYRDRGREAGELLVRADRPRGTPFDRARVTRGDAFER